MCWLLVGAVALIASLTGHAVQLSIESAHLFGTERALYSHALQTPYAALALVMLIVAAFFIGRGMLMSVRDEFDGADWLLPALDAVRSIAPTRLVAIVLSLQFGSLI
ncbi:MAG: hypothetical protein JO293_01610, partial [Candidatus Eremiobacteraeota bacterium]|nr:hypothetical protein [Candidatus Eremiobacteraeota bacterium]